MHLDHERLDVYTTALDFVALVHRVPLPGGHADLGSQLRRAWTSVVLNIAEGCGEFAPAEKARFYRMARRSAMECAASLDIAVRLELVAQQQADGPRELLVRVVSMLTKLVQSAPGRAR